MKKYIVFWTQNRIDNYRTFLDSNNNNFIVAEKFYNNLIEKQKNG